MVPRLGSVGGEPTAPTVKQALRLLPAVVVDVVEVKYCNDYEYDMPEARPLTPR